MTILLNARNVTLHTLEETFQLVETVDPLFFTEWQSNLPAIHEQEKHALDKLKEGYLNLIKYPPVLENTVQIALVAPLLFLTDFYLPPFRITSEASVSVSSIDDNVEVEGKIDLLVLIEHLWVLVIESKQAFFSVEAGLPQLLSYMLANPESEHLNIGLITTGGSFMFVKLVAGKNPQFAVSRVFEMRNPGNELYTVLRILKQLRQLFVETTCC